MSTRAKKKPSKTESEPPVVNVLDLGSSFSEPIAKEEPPVAVEGIKFDDNDAVPPTMDEPTGKRKYTKRKPKEDSEIPMIDGEMLLLLIDLLIPMVITTTHNVVSKGAKISPDDLMLTEKQKSMMVKFADKCAERININANPFLMLFVGLGGIYTANYMRERNRK